MSVQIIRRIEGEKANIETIDSIKSDNPQISYSNEGRITIRIPQCNGDILIVLNRPLTRELIRFIKSGISENPLSLSWCHECAQNFDNELPF
jgi:hypothetical protein